MLNFPISHAESFIEEEISSSQKFNEDIKFTSNGSIKLPSLSEREEPVVIDASGHKITFDSSQIQIGNNQNLEIKADDVLFTGTLAGGETNGAITIRTDSDTPAQLSFTSKVRFEDASGVVLSTQGQGGTMIFFNQGLEINNMQFGSASMLAKLQQMKMYTTDLSMSKISSSNRANGAGSAFEIWGGGYLNVSQNEGVGTGTLSIEDFEGSQGLYIYGGIVDVQNLNIDNMYIDEASTKEVQGVYALGNLYISGNGEIKNIVGNQLTEGLGGTLISEINSLTIKNITSKSDIARGMRLYEQSGNSSYAEFNELTISNITGATKAEGFNLSAGTDTTGTEALLVHDLDISNVKTSNQDGIATGLIVSTSALRISESAHITTSEISETYDGAFISDPTVHHVRDAAIRVMEGGQIFMDNSSGNYSIDGTIVVGKGITNTDEKAGALSIGGAETVIRGDIYAGNGGTITLNISGKNSLIEGQIDDYHEIGSLTNKVFHNSSFVDAETGEELDVESAGKVALTLSNNATWYARGQSFIDTLKFGENGGLVDLSKNENSSVSINNLTGSGEFTMRLDNDPTKSDMLYIQNLDADAKYQVNVVLNNTTRSVYELEDVRIATTNGHYQSWGDNFTAVLADQGVNDVTFKVTKEAFSTEDEDNTAINGKGDGSDTYKPGEDAVNEIYGVKEGATNWVIASTEGTGSDKPSGPSTSLSDAGNALLATARGTYWTSVEIDRLTNRMGDARYANNGEDGLWIRLRQSRLGTDTGEGDFKSDNTVYQVGYDHAFQRDGGRQLVGIAFDYMDTDLDYKGISGEGNTDRYGITAYTTWLADNGFYVDVVGKWGRLDNDFDIINGSGGRVKADYDNNMWAISAEVGRKLSNPKTGMFIEPNAQLQYTMVTDAQYSTNQGTRVDQDRIDSVIGRMGVRIGRAFGEEQNHNIYAKADMFREFMGEQKIHIKDVTTRVKGDTITVQNKGFWFDVGGGFQSQLGRDAYAYADVEYRFGNDLDKSWIVNAGMRYEF